MAEENRRADALGYRRYLDMKDVNIGVAGGELVPIIGVKINDKLPKDRRYLRPEALSFLERLNRDVGSNLTVDSAIRPADVQRRLGRFNPNAAPFDGYRASSHERGSTFDIARQGLSHRQERFLQSGVFCTTAQSGVYWSFKSEDAITSSSETGENT